MSLQLQPDQVLAALQQAESPKFSDFLDQMLHLCDAMAVELVRLTPEVRWIGVPELWDGMICVALDPIDATQPIPKHLQGFDDEGWE